MTACSPRIRASRTASRSSKRSRLKWRPSAAAAWTRTALNGALFPDRRGAVGAQVVSADADGLAARRLADLHGRCVSSRRRSSMKPSTTALHSLHLAKFAGRDRGFARLIATTTLRHLGSLEVLVGGFLDKPLAAGFRSHALHPGDRCSATDAPRDAAACRHQPGRRSRPHRPYSASLRPAGECGAAPRRGRGQGDPPGARYRAARYSRLAVGRAGLRTYGEETARKIGTASLMEPPLDLSVKGDAASGRSG